MTPMNELIKNDVINALQGDFYGGKLNGKYISKIECPSCHKKEAFAGIDEPWVVKCGRSNNCGDYHHVKELFPEFFETWTERFQPKDEPARIQNPTAVADAYLQHGRGFDLAKISGWYTQEWFQHAELNIGSTTVRFPMPNGFWERVLDKPQRFGSQKARCVGNYKGQVWKAPILDWSTLTSAKQIWITEGIFDAIALMQNGIVAVSNISSSNYIDLFLADLAKACGNGTRPKIIWAQDSDKAGRVATIKHARRAEDEGWNCGAAQPPANGKKTRDWNDLHQLDKLNSKHVEEYLYNGDLLLAKSATAKALLMYHNRASQSFWFDYYGRLYWFKLNIDKLTEERQTLEKDESLSEEQVLARALQAAAVVKSICTAVPTPLYFQQNKLTDESWYYMLIETPDGMGYKCAFTAKQITSATEFKNRLLSVVKNAWYTGSAAQLDRVMQDLMHSLKTVETIDYVGYSKEHAAYIYHDIAVKNGKIMPVNDEDFFEFGKLSVKSLSKSPELIINPKKEDYDPQWATHMVGAFGTVGVITTAFFLGSLFAEQIRKEHSSYPFFELVGLAGAGKTTLIEFLFKLVGWGDHEGEDPNKATVAARARMLIQVSNMPISFIESDRETDKAHAKQFEWDELKPLYNGRSPRSRGVKNNGNDTYSPPFRGSILISQNAQVDASEAILSRILHNTLTREHQTGDSKNHADWLSRVSIEQVSGFLLNAVSAENTLMPLFNSKAAIYEQQLQGHDEIRMVRIAKNHGQLLALLDCLGTQGLDVFPEWALTEARQHVLSMAIERQGALNADHPAVTEFWEAYDYIQNMGGSLDLNHYGHDAKQIAVNLKEFERWAGEYRLKLPDMASLKNLLRSSKNRKFIESNKTINSKVAAKTVRCWVFNS